MPSIRRLTFTLALGAALALGSLTPARSADPLQIDVILPLTGGGAFIGKEHQASLQALENAVNKQGGVGGRPVEFVFHDDQTNPQVAVQLANQVLAKKPPIVLGSSLSAMCKAMAPLFAANGPVQYCLSPAIYPAKGAYTFAANVSTKDDVIAFMRYFHAKGWKRIGALATTDASGQDFDDIMKDLLTQAEFKDMSMVAAEHMNGSDTSAAAQASRIKAANPQIVILWTPGTPLGTALHALNDVGLDVPTATTSANMVAKQIESYNAFLPKEFLFTGQGFIVNYNESKAVQGAVNFFTDALKTAGIAPIDFQSGMAYDPAWITIGAFKKLGPNATAEQLRTYLSNLKGFAGVNGSYDFTVGDQHGIGVKSVLVFRWEPGKTWWSPVSGFGGSPK